jgi:hypothetical protein
VHTATSNGLRPLRSSGWLKKAIIKAWSLLRYSERAWERGVQEVRLNLKAPVETTLGQSWGAYDRAMRERRKAQTEAWASRQPSLCTMATKSFRAECAA